MSDDIERSNLLYVASIAATGRKRGSIYIHHGRKENGNSGISRPVQLSAHV